MERERSISKHEAIVQPFLIGAFKEGAHRIKPKHTAQDQWFRQIMIGVVYNDIGSSATYEELADKHGAFKQSISHSNRSFLRNLWNNSSPELQGRYPLSEVLSARKPWSQTSRERSSAVKGEVSLRIKEQVDSGVTDIDKISENTGIPRESIREAASGALKDWGVDIPKKGVFSYREVLEQLDKETDDEKIQELLDGLPYYVIRYDLQRKRESSQFSRLFNLTKEAGFNIHIKDVHFFAESLESFGVPISRKDKFLKDGRRQTYYVLLSRHKGRVAQALKEDHSLQRFQR